MNASDYISCDFLLFLQQHLILLDRDIKEMTIEKNMVTAKN